MQVSVRNILLAGLTGLLCACSAPDVQRVYGRYVPERKDDFAWENEFAAYRMYGPELAKYENPSNGIDIFMKNTPAFVIDTFFYYYTTEERPYHVQHGYGFDGYKVAHTPGMGGVAAWVDSTVYVGGPYDTWEIIEQTNTLFKFRLHYDSLNIAGNILQEDITITCESGKALNKAEVVVSGTSDIPFCLGAGLWLHDSIGEWDCADGLVTYTENAMSDPGAVRLNKKWYDIDYLGETHEAIYVQGKDKILMPGNVLVIGGEYTLGDTLTYYFGGCWSGWTDGEMSFPTHADWKQYISEQIKQLK